jgi:hypothetical protein
MAYKNLVKHKKRVNHVFSELGVETSFRSRRPSVDKKAAAVAVASCSAAPPKAPRRKSSKKGKSNTGDTSCSASLESLESSKRKCKASEGVSYAEIQAASCLAQLGQKRAKKLLRRLLLPLFIAFLLHFQMTRWLMIYAQQVFFLFMV